MSQQGVDYRIEHARRDRSNCQGKCKQPIDYDALRLNTYTNSNGQKRTLYAHFPDCVSQKVAQHIIARYGTPDKIPGMRALDGQAQKRGALSLQLVAKGLPIKSFADEEQEDEMEDKLLANLEEEEQNGGGNDNNDDDDDDNDQEEEDDEPPAKRRQGQQGQRQQQGQKGQQGQQRGQQGQQKGQNNVSADGRYRQAQGGKKGQAVRRAKEQGREYQEGEENDMYGPPGEQRGRQGGVGRGQSGHNNVSAEGRRRQAEGGKKGAAVRQAKAEGRNYQEGEEFDRYGAPSDKEDKDAEDDEPIRDHNNVSAEGRRRQAEGGKKGAAVRQAKAEGREYREGEEVERYGPVGQYKGGNKDNEDPDYQVAEADDDDDDFEANVDGADDDDDNEEEEDDGQQQQRGGNRGGNNGGRRQNNVSDEGRRRQAEGGKKGAAVRQAKAEGREYHEGEEYERYGNVGQKRGRQDNNNQGTNNRGNNQGNNNKGDQRVPPSKGGEYYQGNDPLRKHLSEIGKKGGKNSHGGRGKNADGN